MAKKKEAKEVPEKKDIKIKKSNGRLGGLRDEALQSVIAIGAFVVAIFMLLASWARAGWAGSFTYYYLHILLGVGYYLLPLILIVLGIAYLKNINQRFDTLKLIGSLLFLLSSLGLLDIAQAQKGGLLGSWVAYPFVKLFATQTSVIFLSAILVVSVIVAFNAEMDFGEIFSKLKWKRERKYDDEEAEGDEAFVEEEPREIEVEEPEQKTLPVVAAKKIKEEKVKIAAKEEDSFIAAKAPRRNDKAYVPPPLELLEKDHGTPGVGDVSGNARHHKKNAREL